MIYECNRNSILPPLGHAILECPYVWRELT
jgi:hypothetical protein